MLFITVAETEKDHRTYVPSLFRTVRDFNSLLPLNCLKTQCPAHVCPCCGLHHLRRLYARLYLSVATEANVGCNEASASFIIVNVEKVIKTELVTERAEQNAQNPVNRAYSQERKSVPL